MTAKILLVSLVLGGALMSHAASAQSDIGLKRVGATIGYVSPEDLDGTVGFGAFADLGTFTPNIGWEAHLEYWSQSEESFGAKASVHDIVLGSRAKYLFQLKDSSIRPFAGGGLSMHFLKATVSFSDPNFGTMEASDSATKLGLDLGGGLATSLSEKVDFHAETWYVISDIDQFSLRMGLSMKMGS
jgi:opacity protein-like surface antigen